tara:strand:+ start:1754 stop:2209 length:456 start_codon:yes stop_codon:yes gene_type:complete
MVVKTYTPSIAEVLTKVNNAKTKDKKIAILKENDSEALRAIIKSSFDPNIQWVMPEGDVPYKPNEVPEGTEHTRLNQEYRQLWHYIKGADAKTPQFRKEQMFVQLLEGLHEDEAKVLCQAKDKVLHQKYKGLSDNVVKEAFGWNENYVRAT